jgi:transcriptional regulator with XRE-family HTH domain
MGRTANAARSGEHGLGERVRELRTGRGLSQVKLARACGITPAHLSRVESGSRDPSARLLARLARRLGVSVDYLESGIELTLREELEAGLLDAELKVRLGNGDETAEQQLKALVKLAEREGAFDIASRARGALGAYLAAGGRLREAARELELALESPVIKPEVYPDAYTPLIRTYQRLGRHADAVARCELTLAEVHADDLPLRTMVASQLSASLADLGDFERAEQVLTELRSDVELVDPYARARMHWSLALVATAQEKRRLALRHMHRAIALLKQTEDVERLTRAHILCAQILLWGGRTGGVERHLDAARQLLPKGADTETRGSLLGFEALLAARQGQHLKAAMLAAQSLEVLRENEVERSAALYAQALAAASEQLIDRADRCFDQTIRILTGSEMNREAGAVAWEWERCLRESGHPQRARKVAALASSLAAQAVPAPSSR